MPTSIESLHLCPELVAACRRQGFREATPIQALVVPLALKGKDLVVEAKTGSGKTLAYGLPLLEVEPLQRAFPEALVVAPTRELADQITAELTRTRGALDRSIVSLTGGGGMDRQKAALDAGVQIAVGTPGRLEELVARQLLRLDHVRTLVLDEVDELIRGGFADTLASLLEHLTKSRQTLLFSATVPTEVETLARRFTTKAQRVQASQARELPAEIAHRVRFTKVEDRVADLVTLLAAYRPYQTLIFCGTRHETEEVQAALGELGLEAEFLHGELSPVKRRALLAHFRSGDLPVLVASDLAARGLDLPGVELVVNYSLPPDVAGYLHRTGRTGRAGRPGTAVSLVIGQQHELFEKLKATFLFESLDVARGRVVSHTMKSREARDEEYRKPPEARPRPPPTTTAPPPRFERRDKRTGKGRGDERGGKKPPRGNSKRGSRKPPRRR